MIGIGKKIIKLSSLNLHFDRFDTTKTSWDHLANCYTTTNPFYCYQLIQNLNHLHQQLEQYVIDFQSQMHFFLDQPTWKNVDDALVFIIYRDHHHRTHQ
jgi:hypothetical protein